jgi:hypothetical protein
MYNFNKKSVGLIGSKIKGMQFTLHTFLINIRMCVKYYICIALFSVAAKHASRIASV